MSWINQTIQHPSGVNVFGSAVIRTDPDRAVAEIGVTRLASKASTAFEETRKAVASVSKSLSSSGIPTEAVEISRVTLRSAFDGFGANAKFIGYQAEVSFRIVIEALEKVEPVLSAAVEAGANQVTSVSYLTSRLRELRAEARQQAVRGARAKAEVYCEAGGARLGNVIHIEDVDPDSLAMRGGHGESLNLSAQDEAESGALQSGSLVVSAAVVVGYSLLLE
ncbi:MAG: SIMPL domain-containing protein [Acidimicrobiales bacterium]